MAPCNIRKNKLLVITVNARSLRSNFDELNLFIENHNFKFDILGVTESWIKKEESFAYQIPGYKMYTQERSSKLGGGVALYVKNDLYCSTFEVVSEECNGLRFSVTDRSGNLVSGLLLYRFCKSSVTKFLSTLENQSTLLSGHAVVFGDLNLNIIPPHNNHAYLNLMATLGFRSEVNEPTRVLGSSSSCIDHLFQRFPNGQYNAKKIDYSLHDVPFSDHKLTRFSIELGNTLSDQPHNKEFPIINWDAVAQKITSTKWDNLYCINDVNEAFRQFFDIIGQIVNSETRTKLRKEMNKKRSTWASSELVTISKSKHRLYNLVKKYPDNAFLKGQLKKVTREMKARIKLDKKTYFTSKLEMCGSDPRKYWRLVKNKLSSPQFAVDRVETEQGYIQTDGNEKLVANAFNTFYIDKVSEILNSATTASGNTNNSNQSLPPEPRLDRTFRVSPITHRDVVETLKRLPNKLSKGTDGITSIFLKNNAVALTPPLVWLFNLSMSKGIFPESLKEAIVVPLHKGGDPSQMTNYRPISLLSTISKLFEKIIHGRLISFWTKYNIFSNKQFGFLPGRSTEMAIFSHMKEIVGGIEGGEFVASIYLDIMKAFDAVQHDTLLAKLEKAGIRGLFLNWFSTYLKGRRQRVKINGMIGDARITTTGVPQGSCLGPLLFLIYINGVLQLNLQGTVYAYADDTAVLYRDKSGTRLIERMNADLNVLQSWFSAHSLLPNVGKTKIMAFGYRRILNLSGKIKFHKGGETNCPNTCGCVALEQVDSWKYLGLHLDLKVTWAKQLSNLHNKIRGLCLLLYYASKFFGRTHLKRIYMALFEPNLRYGLTQWGSAGSEALIPVERLQRKAIRTMAGIRIGQNSSIWFSKLKILTLNELHRLELVVLAHRHKDRNDLFVFRGNSRMQSEQSNRTTSLLAPPWIRLRSRSQAPYSAVDEFNRLPIKIRKIINFKAFRKKASEYISGGTANSERRVRE